MPRALLPLALLAIALATTWWLWVHAPAPRPVVAPTPAPATPLPTASLPPVVTEEAHGFRLAGTAVGDSNSYAAVELPDGSSNLYRMGAEIPGLGQLTEIAADHVVIDSDDGQSVLWVKPAATSTPDRRRLGREPARAAATPSSVREPQPDQADRDDTTDESEPEGDPDQPVS